MQDLVEGMKLLSLLRHICCWCCKRKHITGREEGRDLSVFIDTTKLETKREQKYSEHAHQTTI